MKCKGCRGWLWSLVWAYATKEEEIHVHMWQCQGCKRVVMASDMTAESDRVTI